jgi:hypothetical protein
MICVTVAFSGSDLILSRLGGAAVEAGARAGAAGALP